MRNGKELLEALRSRIIVCDGAMGTELHAKGISINESFDNINITNPEIVTQIHYSYLKAGAELIETNTFGANRFKLAHYNLADKVKEINTCGAEIALFCAKDNGWVAGSIGPLGRLQENVADSQKEEAFKEHAEALINAGLQIIILETFSSLSELLIALKAVKSVDKNAVVIAQLSFNKSGKTINGDEIFSSFLKLHENGADIVGSNCIIGPLGHLNLIKNYGNKINIPLSVFPNAGFPEQIGDRMMYNSNSEYLANFFVEFVNAGANLIGGCCGTTPEDIRRASLAVKNLKPVKKTDIPLEKIIEEQKKIISDKNKISGGELKAKLAAGKKIISVELDPPKGLNYENVIEGARALKDAGVDIISLSENPLSIVRMSNVTIANVIKRDVGIESIIHLTGRDRNLVGMQSALMGMAVDGIKNILAVTGDPPSRGGEDKVTGVYDLNSYELIKLIKRLNEGENYYGDNIKKRSAFTIGAAFNPNVLKIEAQVERLKKKIDFGAEFVQTQPVFDKKKVEEMITVLKDVKIPVFLGILPLVSSRNTEFLHNEIPGIIIPDDIRKRMADAGENGIEEGINVAWEIIDYALPHFAGIYIMPPFNKYEIAIELVKRIKLKLR